MKINYIGIIGGILAFISLVLPWWTLRLSVSIVSFDMSLYPYQFTAVGVPVTAGVPWYCWVALALIVVGGVLGIVGSITRYGRRLVAAGGALSLLSIIVFAVALQLDLMQGASELAILGVTGLGIFSSGTITFMSQSFSYSTFLSFGFWLALVSAIVLFVAVRMHPKEELAPPPPPPMPQQPPPEAPPPPGP